MLVAPVRSTHLSCSPERPSEHSKEETVVLKVDMIHNQQTGMHQQAGRQCSPGGCLSLFLHRLPIRPSRSTERKDSAGEHELSDDYRAAHVDFCGPSSMIETFVQRGY